MVSQARTVQAYLAALPPDRGEVLRKVRAVIRKNLPPGFEEGMQFGMIGYYVPLARYPETYNGQPLCLAGLAAQKNHLAVYLMSVYGDPATRRWFEKAFRDAGKKLDMGKSCLRFRSAEDLPLDVVGEAIRRVTLDSFIAHYESARGTSTARRTSARKTAKPPARKPGQRATRTTTTPAAKKPAARASGRVRR
jgi:hypothetical protein